MFRYHLEHQNKHGHILNENDTLESTHTMEFYLARQHSSRNENGNGKAYENLSKSLPQPLYTKEHLFNEFKRFRLNHVQKYRSTEVLLTVSSTQVDIDPIAGKESRLTSLFSPRLKPLSIPVLSIAYCEMIASKPASIPSSSSLSSSGGESLSGTTSTGTSFASQFTLNYSNEKCLMKIYYKLPELRSDFKHCSLEGLRPIVIEAVEFIQQIMLYGNLELQETYKSIKNGAEVDKLKLSRKKSIKTLFPK